MSCRTCCAHTAASIWSYCVTHTWRALRTARSCRDRPCFTAAAPALSWCSTVVSNCTGHALALPLLKLIRKFHRSCGTLFACAWCSTRWHRPLRTIPAPNATICNFSCRTFCAHTAASIWSYCVTHTWRALRTARSCRDRPWFAAAAPTLSWSSAVISNCTGIAHAWLLKLIGDFHRSCGTHFACAWCSTRWHRSLRTFNSIAYHKDFLL